MEEPDYSSEDEFNDGDESDDLYDEDDKGGAPLDEGAKLKAKIGMNSLSSLFLLFFTLPYLSPVYVYILLLFPPH
jgi:hypothetical protein